MSIQLQLIWLFTLALPVACISWTVTHEEILKEPRDFCVKCSKDSKTVLQRKFFYLFTCEYCFSHYVTVGILLLSGYHLLMMDWRGYILAGFSLVWVANIYMSIYNLIRVDMKEIKVKAELVEKKLKKIDQTIDNKN